MRPESDGYFAARMRLNIAAALRRGETIPESAYRKASRTAAVVQAEADAREKERNERHSRGDSRDDDDPWVWRPSKGDRFGGGNSGGPLGGLGF